MALPKLNNTPYYDVTIPSTGVKTRYRPYLVKEEKVLLIASESDDDHAMSEAMLNVICECVENLNKSELTTFDIQYLFLQLRSKSVGETSDLLFTCQNEDCSHQNDFKLKLSDVKVDMPKDKNDKIELSEDMILELKYPTYENMINDKIMRYAETGSEIMYQTVLLSLEALQTNDERMIFVEEPIEDIIEFIGNLSTAQFNKITDFTNNIPVLKHDVEFTCQKCNHKNKSLIAGNADFFL
jgi:hypothetical protein